MPRFDDDDEFKIGGAKTENYESGGRPYLQVPSGLGAFNYKTARTVALEIIPYKVGEASLRYDTPLQFAPVGEWYPHRTFYMHSGIGPDNERHACARATFRKPCPVCEVRDRFAQKPDKENQDKAYDLKPARRQLRLVMERDDATGELSGRLLLWDESYHSFGKQLATYVDGSPRAELEQNRLYWHPLRGLTVVVQGKKEPTGSGGGEYTKWGVYSLRPRRVEIPREVFRHGYDLDTFIVETPYDELRSRFLGTDEPAAEAAVGKVSAPVTAEPRWERNGNRPAPQESPQGPQEPRSYRSSAENPPTTPTRAEREANAPRTAPAPEPAPRASAPAAKPAPKPAPAPAPAEEEDGNFASGDTVSFRYKGDRVEGRILKVNLDKKWADVEVEGWDKHVKLDFEEMRLVARVGSDTFDLPTGGPEEEPAPAPAPAPRAKEGRPSKWDDEEDDGGRTAPPPKARGKK